jgi:putative membrane protein
MSRCLTATLAVAALMFTASAVRADVNDKVRMMKSPADSKEFAMKAAESGMLEVKLGQLAQQKAQSQEVKRLGQMLEQDHTQANQQLMAIAKQKNIDIPADLKGENQEQYQAFQQLEGKDFDNAFLLFNVKSHLKSVMMFQKEAQNGTDAEVKAFAAQTLPKLQQHTGHINMVAQSAGIPMDALAGGGSTGTARPAGSRIQGGSTGGTTGGTTGGSSRTPGTGAGPEANEGRVGSGGDQGSSKIDQDKK